ncbi:MAG TPA: TetR/AcrR family transcriptional regulator [Streptosporangiaceae bacterium]|jgi:AcrR family transcriptional regulator
MQVRDGSSGTPSPAASARRAQIIAAAIEVLAELGYGQTSFAKIAKRAGISSTRLISYHFAGKDELIQAVAEEAMGAAVAFMQPRIRAASGHWERVAVYITANLEFMRDRPSHIRSIVEIANNARTEDGRPYALEGPVSAVSLLEQEFREGQRDGAYLDFDPLVMARTLRAAIDNAALQHSLDPELDLDSYAAELVRLFGRAIRKDTTS